MKHHDQSSYEPVLDRPSKPSDRHACLNDPRFKSLLDEFDTLLDKFLCGLNEEVGDGEILDFVIKYLMTKRYDINEVDVQTLRERQMQKNKQTTKLMNNSIALL